MTYDWTDPSEGNKLPAGTHTVSITKIVRTKKLDGRDVALSDRDGNPQVGIGFQGADGREGMAFFQLAGNFVWKLRKLLQAVLTRKDLEYLTANGFTPLDFTEPAKSDAIVVGKWLLMKGVQNGEHVNWTPMPLPSDAVPAAAPQASDADVPF